MFSSSSSVISTWGYPVTEYARYSSKPETLWGKDYESFVCFSLLEPESEVSAVVIGVFLLNYSKFTKSCSDILESSKGILDMPFWTSFSLVVYSPRYFYL